MKHLSPIQTSLLLGLGLLVAATNAAADPGTQTTTAGSQTKDGSGTQITGQLAGSDTLEDIAKAVIAAAPAITDDDPGLAGRGVTEYLGLGSSAGERQLTGDVTSTSEPSCSASGAATGDNNWGCMEVAPMSRVMGNTVCNDDTNDPDDADDSSTANSTAEGLAVCLDGISLITDNDSHRQYADDLAHCVAPSGDAVWGPSSDNSAGVPGINGYASTGKLRTAGALTLSGGGTYTLGSATVPAWKDVLRLIYTGCKNSDDCSTAAASPSRANRCDPAVNTARAALVNDYQNIFEGVDCPEGNHCTQLRAAYRRDDASGTTTFFLESLGINTQVSARTRPDSATGSGKSGFATVPENMYCDGGAPEGMWPRPYTTGTAGVLVVADLAAGLSYAGDPLQRTCAPEDDLCGSNGTIGLVRPIRSPREGGFPLVQCTKNAWSKRPWPNTRDVPSCPDGTAPAGNSCYAPYFFNPTTGEKNFDCLNPANGRPPSVPLSQTPWDGRVFNWVWRLHDGDLSNSAHVAANTALLPEMAQWRQNMATVVSTTGLDTTRGGAFGSTTGLSQQVYAAQGPQAQFTKSYASTAGMVCNQGSATSLIGCIVGNTRCVIAFAGREAADRAPADDNQEAIRLPGTVDGLPTVSNDKEIITDHYPLSRSLFINAIGGFENTVADCAARGGSQEYCSDEAEFARRFYQMGTAARNACLDNGFIPIVPDAAVPGCNGDATCNADMAKRYAARCIGAASAETGVTAAGCGRKNGATETLSSGKQLPHQDEVRCNPDEGRPEGPPSGGVCTDVSANSGADATCG